MKLSLQALAWLMLCVAGSAFAASPSSVLATYDVYKGSIKVAQIEETYTRQKRSLHAVQHHTPGRLAGDIKTGKDSH